MLQFAGGFYTDLITVPKGSHDDFLGSGLRVQNNTQKRLDCLGLTGIRVRISTLQNHSKKEPLYPRGMLVLPSALKEPLTPPALGLVSRERHVPE